MGNTIHGASAGAIATPTSRPDADQAPTLQGQYRGETVTVETKSAQSLVADAAEELTFGHSEKVHHKLQERKPKSAREFSAELADKWIQKVPDAGETEKFTGLAESIKKQGNVSPKQLRQQLEDHFKRDGDKPADVSHQFAALAFLEELFEKEPGREDLLASVRTAKRELEFEHGPAIRAGLNVSEIAAEYEKVGDVGDLRDFYRERVLEKGPPRDFAGVRQAYDETVARYGKQQFPAAVDFLFRSLGRELSLMEPSPDKSRVQSANDSLYFLQVMRNTHEAFEGIIGKLRAQYGVAAGGGP